MPLRDCTVIAIEGTQASGKTTLVHALVAYYRQRGVHVDCTGEPARTSPFLEDIVIHGKGTFDLLAEVDLFAAQLTTQARASRHHQLLVADKTITNVLAYARLVLAAAPGSHETAVLDAMVRFCRAWAHTYDLVFFCPDHYGQADGGDRFRAKVLGLQDDVAQTLRETCAEAGISLVDIPPGLTVEARVEFIAGQLRDRGLPAGLGTVIAS